MFLVSFVSTIVRIWKHNNKAIVAGVIDIYSPWFFIYDPPVQFMSEERIYVRKCSIYARKKDVKYTTIPSKWLIIVYKNYWKETNLVLSRAKSCLSRYLMIHIEVSGSLPTTLYLWTKKENVSCFLVNFWQLQSPIQ